MRPHDLKSPYRADLKQVMIQDRVWYIPSDCKHSGFAFPGWVHPLMFDQSRPICIEYCSGNGLWIATKARLHPEYNWLAIERKFERVKKIWSKIKNENLKNLIVAHGEGNQITKEYIPSESVQSVFINFPDPWPKRRHAKNRLIQVFFIDEIYRILQSKGTVTLVTDEESYSQQMRQVFSQLRGFESIYPSPYYVTECHEYGTSYFEDLWRQKGKTIFYHTFCKISLQ